MTLWSISDKYLTENTIFLHGIGFVLTALRSDLSGMTVTDWAFEARTHFMSSDQKISLPVSQ